MSFSRPQRERRAALPLTPLIDMLFILIVFFAVTSSFREEEQQVDVKLVATETGETVEPTATDTIINVKADGTTTIGNRTFTHDELRGLLERLVAQYPDERVVVRGDREAKYEAVLAVLDAARAAGVRDARMATTFKASEAGQ